MAGFSSGVRSTANLVRISQLMDRLGQEVRSPGTVYFTGGVSAVLLGWRDTTLDADIKGDPEPAGLRLLELSRQIEAQIIRFPAVSADLLRQRIEECASRCT